MKTQIKQLLFGILATSCFGLSCTSLTWAAEEYHWPPKDGEPIVTLVGPVYETGSETQAPLFKALEQAMTTIVEHQQTHLPKSFQQRIAGLKHQLFRPGYSNEEEWGSIKSLSSKAEDYDTERMVGILESSENRKPGLEMAIRMQPTIDPQPASVMLEGYRFVLQPSGKGQAEWFTQEVKLTGRKAGEAFRKALIWQLSKPFEKAQKTFVLDDRAVPVWKDKNTAGVLTFANKKFTADAKPIRKETVEACVQTSFCPEINVEGNEFALVSNFASAQAICQMFKRVVIDKDTLLRLSLTEEGSNLLDEENGAAWHSGGESGFFEENFNHHDFIPVIPSETAGRGQSAVVWCHSPVRDTFNFQPRPDNYVIDRGWRTIKLYKSYWVGLLILDEELVVEFLDYDELYPVKYGRILDNSFSDVANEGDRVFSVRSPQSRFVFGISSERYPIDVIFSESGLERSIEAPVWRLGGTFMMGKDLGMQFGLGFSKPGLSQTYHDDQGSTTINGEIGGHFLAGLWGYLKLLPNIRWQGNLGFDTFELTTKTSSGDTARASYALLNLDVRLRYQWENLGLSVGMISHTGASNKLDQATREATISIPAGVNTLLGIQYDFPSSTYDFPSSTLRRWWDQLSWKAEERMKARKRIKLPDWFSKLPSFFFFNTNPSATLKGSSGNEVKLSYSLMGLGLQWGRLRVETTKQGNGKIKNENTSSTSTAQNDHFYFSDGTNIHRVDSTSASIRRVMYASVHPGGDGFFDPDYLRLRSHIGNWFTYVWGIGYESVTLTLLTQYDGKRTIKINTPIGDLGLQFFLEHVYFNIKMGLVPRQDRRTREEDLSQIWEKYKHSFSNFIYSDGFSVVLGYAW